MRFPWLIFLGLLFLHCFLLNPKCWPAEGENQKSEIRNQKLEIHYLPFTIFSYRANPYVEPKLKLIGLGPESRKSKTENRKSPLFPIPYSLFPSAPPQTAGPHDADQVLLKVYDAVNGALKANATLSGGSTNPTPHNADQVFLAVYDPVHGAIRVNVVAGGGSGSYSFPANKAALASNSASQPIAGTQVYDIRDYGAVNDERSSTDGACSANGYQISSTSLAFTGADVTKAISIYGGGAAQGTLLTTVSSVTGGVATVASPCLYTVSGGYVSIGTDNTAAMQNTVNAASAVLGGTVRAVAGYYKITSPITWASGVTLLGDLPTIYAPNPINSVPPGNPTNPAGGTWFDCSGGASCITGNYLRQDGFVDFGVKNFGATAFSFGGSNIDGISFSHAEYLFAIGLPTIGASDTAWYVNNFQFFETTNLNAFNVNVGAHLLQQNDYWSGGNSHWDHFYIQTYAKTAAHGNASRPEIWLDDEPTGSGSGQPMNSMYMSYAQTNSYGGDGTNVHIKVGGSGGNYEVIHSELTGLDVEGAALAGVYCTTCQDVLLGLSQFGSEAVYFDANSWGNVAISHDTGSLATGNTLNNQYFGQWNTTGLPGTYYDYTQLVPVSNAQAVTAANITPSATSGHNYPNLLGITLAGTIYNGSGSVVDGYNLAQFTSTSGANPPSYALWSRLAGSSSAYTGMQFPFPVSVGDTKPWLPASSGNPYFQVSESAANSGVEVGQASSNNLQLWWNYNATPGSAYAKLFTYGYTTNKLLIDAANLTLQDLSGGGVGIGKTPVTSLDIAGSVRTYQLSVPVNGTITPADNASASCAANTAYYYKVQAGDGLGYWTAPSTETSVTTLNDGNPQQITFAWSAVNGAVGGYKIFRGTSSGAEGIVATVATGVASLVDTCGTTPGAAPAAVGLTGTESIAGNLTVSGTITGSLTGTATNCAATGSAANPSLVACSAAEAGQFSCSVSASTGTCKVSTSAVLGTADEIFVQPSAAATISSVTCNTSADTGLTAPRLASQAAGYFIINLGTFSINPVCFNYWVVN
jgi:hypothetical protein